MKKKALPALALALALCLACQSALAAVSEKVLSRAIEIIGQMESGHNYATVIVDSNGKISAGFMQWNAGRAAALVEKAIQASGEDIDFDGTLSASDELADGDKGRTIVARIVGAGHTHLVTAAALLIGDVFQPLFQVIGPAILGIGHADINASFHIGSAARPIAHVGGGGPGHVVHHKAPLNHLFAQGALAGRNLTLGQTRLQFLHGTLVDGVDLLAVDGDLAGAG